MAQAYREALLRSAALRATHNPFFLGSALAAYQSEHRLDDRALAHHLFCPVSRLSRLALCRRPDPASPSFRQDVEQIAAYARAQPLRLGALLREVDAALALRGARDSGTALLAARDADPDGADEPRSPLSGAERGRE